MLNIAIQRVQEGFDLSLPEMAAALGMVMEGRASPDEVASFLLALRAKGESVAEVAGAALALRQQMTPIRTSRTGVLDTCGTGGDGSHTFNISTAAAIVTAAAGVPVAKHGNIGISSRSGSADALAALGVNIRADVACVERCLDELGLCFCFAPLLHTAMRHVAVVRKNLGVPTIFNILGPLANPARAPYQLLGVGRAPLQPVMAAALGLLGVQRAVVVHGTDGLDEVTLNGATDVIEVTPQGRQCDQWTPEDFGVPRSDLAGLTVEGPEQSAAVIQEVLGGQAGPARDIVVANAAAALWTARRSDTLGECAALAGQAIDSGAGRDLLRRLAALSQRQ